MLYVVVFISKQFVPLNITNRTSYDVVGDYYDTSLDILNANTNIFVFRKLANVRTLLL